MKSVNATVKSILSAVALVAVLVLNAGTAKANNEKPKSVEDRIPVEVKYVGSLNQQPVLEISLDNANAEDLSVTLKDMDGNVLYSGNFNEKKISKKFQFDNQGSDNIQIKLTISSKKKSYTEVFQVNRSRQVVENVVISKL
ncbi:hypothetical protein [Flavihumibacter solisilvae]|uniref:Uncharacterized protein n=1 Tax=Flavihumibacter solisilvae TaxID=1349421 RepID=A0A0C1L8D1_9BACT|nr:hypothetical protein [Flavihumibacter solisilvae]KIC95861.1 hypothetical protein OI18_04335 [Flavihumibacter solisilvae]